MSVSQPLAGRMPGTLVLERSYSFSSSHRYYRPEWTPEKNLAVFGKCSNFPAHGHNYRLTVEVSGAVDRETGFTVNLPELDAVVRSFVVRRLDHAHINDAVPEFAAGGEIPTTENLAVWIAGEIAAHLPATSRLESVRLAEDDRLASKWTRR
jgi:6-pyruvoyltetrahydropterin/6-carboxytetrahydropterin synthase